MDEPERSNLTQCSSGRRSCGGGESKSPEFEFWMVGNPSFPQPNLLSADELFSGGVLLPLHHLRLSHPPQQPEPSGSGHAPDPETSGAEPAAMSATTPVLTSSKRWTDFFRKNEKKIDNNNNNNNKEMKENISAKEKRREKKSGGGGGGGGASTAAELNINIWPFSRSRSAGTGGTRPRTAAPPSRKVSSAPCSRSNSRGDSKSRKWPSSPARGGVHLGRSSPVWQVRRGGGGGGGGKNEGRRKVAPVAGGSNKGRVLSLNVPMCIGYRHQLNCRSDESGVAAVAVVAGGGGSGEGVRVSNLFSIKSLFTRKVY